MAEQFDVVIVGGRVAGSTLAAMLGQRGVRTLVLEQAVFPSDTFSTGGSFPDSFGIWADIGAWQAIDAIGATHFAGFDWYRSVPGDRVRGVFLPVNNRPFGMGLRRDALDSVLSDNAKSSSNVEYRENTRVSELLWEGGSVVGVRYETRGVARGTLTEPVRASLVVGADGRHSIVAKRVGATNYNVVPPLYFPFFTHMEGIEPINPPMIEIYEVEHSRPRHSVLDPAETTIMLMPIDHGKWVVAIYTAFSTEAWDEFRRNPERVFLRQLRSHPLAAERTANARNVYKLRGRGDLSNYMRTPSGRGWALVGDAGQYKDPIFGQGMGDAARTACLLTNAVCRALAGESDWPTALAEFHTYRDFDLLPNFDWMVKGAPKALKRTEFEEVMSALGQSPALANAFVNLFVRGVSANEFFSSQTLLTVRGHSNGEELVEPVRRLQRWQPLAASNGDLGTEPLTVSTVIPTPTS